jgi:hypothetical protein
MVDRGLVYPPIMAAHAARCAQLDSCELDTIFIRFLEGFTKNAFSLLPGTAERLKPEVHAVLSLALYYFTVFRNKVRALCALATPRFDVLFFTAAGLHDTRSPRRDKPSSHFAFQAVRVRVHPPIFCAAICLVYCTCSCCFSGAAACGPASCVPRVCCWGSVGARAPVATCTKATLERGARGVLYCSSVRCFILLVVTCCGCVQASWPRRAAVALEYTAIASRIACLLNLIAFLRWGAFASLSQRLAGVHAVRNPCDLRCCGSLPASRAHTLRMHCRCPVHPLEARQHQRQALNFSRGSCCGSTRWSS